MLADLDLTVSFPTMAGPKKLPDVCFPSIYQHFMQKSIVVAVKVTAIAVGDNGDASTDTEICLLPNCIVKMALCICTAGLSGCCNHMAALLYAHEEFVRIRLQDEEESPTLKLCR